MEINGVSLEDNEIAVTRHIRLRPSTEREIKKAKANLSKLNRKKYPSDTAIAFACKVLNAELEKQIGQQEKRGKKKIEFVS